jgi:hypothetical protein
MGLEKRPQRELRMRAWEQTKKVPYRSSGKKSQRKPQEGQEEAPKGAKGHPGRGKRNGRKTESKNEGAKESLWEPQRRPLGARKGIRNQIIGAPMKALGNLERDPGRDLKGTPRKLEKELQMGLLEGLGRGSKGTAGESGKRKRGMGKGRRNQIMGAPMKAPW